MQQALKSALTQLFDREQHTLTALNRILATELEALQAQDTAALEQAARDKAERMQELEGMERDLSALLSRAGYGSDRDGIETCIARCDHSGDLAGRWTQLLQSLQQCQERNRHNGAAIEIHRRHTRSALAVLRGESPDPATYAASGQTDNAHTGTRPLAKA
ncbi:flagellar biosynthesis/type III secretory pathway chaperone [Thiohalobacter thiocyanaticus]|uniref:Flagellar biosynthesis/type III secretory pathway chaperone n=1 Tax=Thiohalobacter thiocyanaticus TaxID=585455 RepID=A0A1Z4VQE6_9GAMM|nr:flagellar protein FlgN [Thiohalobacter thiocyanaticus]BAZ93841.1 flagellar biosynthesis/type III secretory pathway chaperone [Thiohalobacter thiocyanaticus]